MYSWSPSKRGKAENIFEEIMAKYISNLMKTIKYPQIFWIHRFKKVTEPQHRNWTHQGTSYSNCLKLMWNRIFKNQPEEKRFYVEKNKDKIAADLFWQQWKPEVNGPTSSKYWKKYCHPRILYPTKISFKKLRKQI